MSFLKPVIILAMSTALTACASAPNAAADLTEAKVNPNAASITMVRGYYGGGWNPVRQALYQICESGNCEEDSSAFKSFPVRRKETEAVDVAANEPVKIFAGFVIPVRFFRDYNRFQDGKDCTKFIEFTPKAGRSYHVTLDKEDKQGCSFVVTEQ